MRLMSSASTPACSPRSGATPPTTLVPPPNGTTASEQRAHSSSSARSCSCAVGIDDRVGRALGLAARAGARGRDSPCPRRAARARRARRGRRRAPTIARSCASAGSAQRRGAAGAPGRARPADAAARRARPSRAGSASACGVQRRRVRRVAPAPPAHRRGVAARQPLIRSRPSSASSIVAAAARRTMKPPKRGRSPVSVWRSSIVTSVATRLTVDGVAAGGGSLAACGREAHLGLGRAQQTRERRALDPLRPCERARALVGGDEVEVGAHEFALARAHHLGERVLLDVLHARHARPPARQVVGVADDLPQLLGGCGDRAAATRGGHGRKLRTRR